MSVMVLAGSSRLVATGAWCDGEMKECDMASIYYASEEEAKVLRREFGPRVAEVMFWDDEEIHGPWMAVARGNDGTEIGRRFQQDSPGRGIWQIPPRRCETVKFGVML